MDFFSFVPDKPVWLSVDLAPPAYVAPKLEITRVRDGKVLATVAAKKPRHPVRVADLPGETGEPVLIRLSQGKRDGNASQPYMLKLTVTPRADAAAR